MEKPEKPPPPDPTCPICKGVAHFARAVNARVEFWECETNKHMFVVDKKPPPKVPVAAAPAEPRAEPAAEAEPKAT